MFLLKWNRLRMFVNRISKYIQTDTAVWLSPAHLRMSKVGKSERGPGIIICHGPNEKQSQGDLAGMSQMSGIYQEEIKPTSSLLPQSATTIRRVAFPWFRWAPTEKEFISSEKLSLVSCANSGESWPRSSSLSSDCAVLRGQKFLRRCQGSLTDQLAWHWYITV